MCPHGYHLNDFMATPALETCMLTHCLEVVVLVFHF